MKIIMITVIVMILLMSTSFLNIIFKNFGLKRERFLIFLWPAYVYGAGFCLRLSENKEFVDMGYFLTGFAGLFLSLVWTMGVFLGQIKYHRLKN